MKIETKITWTFCLSFVAVVLSVICICIQFPRIGALDFDYAGVIVGILSLLVTVLMAWQISTMIGIDRHFEDIANHKIEEAVEKIQKENNALQEISWWNSVNMQMLSDNKYMAFCMSVYGLQIATTLKGKSQYRNVISRYFDSFKQHIRESKIEDLKKYISLLKEDMKEWEDPKQVIEIIKEMTDYINQKK